MSLFEHNASDRIGTLVAGYRYTAMVVVVVVHIVDHSKLTTKLSIGIYVKVYGEIFSIGNGGFEIATARVHQCALLGNYCRGIYAILSYIRIRITRCDKKSTSKRISLAGMSFSFKCA